MDGDERLTALKKAYADMILNTAKEAAARIMVSERKAVRFQHELYAAKQEALQMLLRLKEMMDFKITEAEMASLSQQRKIEELEAQLQEAEDIVKDLREELREVQAELDVTPVETSKENRFNISQSIISPPSEIQHESVPASDMGNPDINQRNEGRKFYNSVIHIGNTYVGNPDLPSIILRSKEPDLYRNGCTQRIRACERNLLDGDLCFSEKQNDAKYESNVKEGKEGERISEVPTCEADTMCNIEKNEVVHEDSRDNSWHRVHVVNFSHGKRKRAARFRKNRTPSCRYQLDQFKKRDQEPDISFLTNKNNSAQSEKGPSKMTPSPDTSGRGIEHGCAETAGTDADFVKAYGLQTLARGDEFINDLLLMTEEKIEPTESSEVPVCQMNLEKVDVPLVSSESKVSYTSSVVPVQPVNDRIIKYTFQRKRKRDTLSSSDGNASTEKSTLKIKAGEKEKDSLEPEKSSLIAESSRDSRRLAQVARQLISLSEKKWWQ